MDSLFPLLMRYFGFFAAAISMLNWRIANRRLEASGKPTAVIERGASVARGLYGSLVAVFALMGLMQVLGGYSSVLFFLQLPFANWHVAAVWAGLYGSWALWLFGLWRTDAASAMIDAGMVQPREMSPGVLRWIGTATIVFQAVALPLFAGRTPAAFVR